MASKGDLIGKIVRLQVQRVPIKARGEGYMPGGILAVDRASIDAWGMVGWHDGAWILDSHHKAHPSGRAGGKRPLSVGFTGHYVAMDERFGGVPLGLAGENIIIESPELWLDDLGVGLIVEATTGDLLLERPRVAAPCREFTSYLLNLDEVAERSDIKDELDFLGAGRRGYIVAADHAPEPVGLAVGDEVFLAI